MVNGAIAEACKLKNISQMVNGAIAEACKLKNIYPCEHVTTETRAYNDLICDKMTDDKEYAI